MTSSTIIAQAALRSGGARAVRYRVAVELPIHIRRVRTQLGDGCVVACEVIEPIKPGADGNPLKGRSFNLSLKKLRFEQAPENLAQISCQGDDEHLGPVFATVGPAICDNVNRPALLHWYSHAHGRTAFALPSIMFENALPLDFYVDAATKFGVQSAWSEAFFSHVQRCSDVDAMTKLRLAARWAEAKEA